jgi:hypothetical protein
MNSRLKTVGLQMGRAVLVGITNGPRVRLHDKQPSQNIQPSRANVLGSVFIRVSGVLTVSSPDLIFHPSQ